MEQDSFAKSAMRLFIKVNVQKRQKIIDKTYRQKISDFFAGGGKTYFSLTKSRMILGRERF